VIPYPPRVENDEYSKFLRSQLVRKYTIFFTLDYFTSPLAVAQVADEAS